MEEWRDIKGYENLYQISSRGRVRSLNYNKTGKIKLLKPAKKNNGYLNVVLHKDGKMKNYLVHRLVAEAFIPNPDNLPEINHKSEEDKTDNRVECLEWCDRRYNCNYGTRNQRVAEKRSKPVLQYDKQGNFIKKWASTREVERQLGFNQGNVSACCRGEHKQMYGYIWKYKEERAA